MGKNLSSKCSKKLQCQNSCYRCNENYLKREIQETDEAAVDLIGNKIGDKNYGSLINCTTK